MKNSLKKYMAWTAVLAWVGLTMMSCIKDEVSGGTEETTLTLTVSTRMDDPNQTNNGGKTLEPNEEMEALRVIVARSSDNEILYNWYEKDIKADDFQRVINFSELTIETTGESFDFYAIANEASLDLSSAGITTLEGKNVNLKALKECIINRDYNVWTEGNIPQTAFASKSVVPGTTDDFSMQLEFVVAKVRVSFINETGEEQPISDIRIEGVKPNQGFLFNDDDENSIHIPANTNYATLEIKKDALSVPATEGNNTASASAYLYPSNPGTKFILKAHWNNQDYALEEGTDGNITSGELVTGLDRSQQLDITVTLKKSAVEVPVEIMYEVEDWGTADIEVPSFN